MAASGLVIATILFITLGAGVWVAVSLLSVSVISLGILRSLPVDALTAQSIFNTVTSPELAVVPLFIFMAEVLIQTRVTSALFHGLTPWTTRLPGGLVHLNVIASTFFAAICGSSAATTATVGRISLPELSARKYDKMLAMGSLAGAGTIGFLIPPSIIMIVYGVLSETSILKLFMAGVIPGLLLALLFMLYIAGWSLVNPSRVPPTDTKYSWGERFSGLISTLPIIVLILTVIGSMYTGWASPSEAAGLGVGGALIIALLSGCLSLKSLNGAALRTVRMTSMIGLIVAAASLLSLTMGYLGLPRYVADTIASFGLSPITLMLVLLVTYAILGCFLDGLSTIVLTLPITLPLVVGAGYDKVWFGIFIVVATEMAQITPPLGFNLFVIHNLTGEKISRIAIASIPFFLLLCLFAILLILYPEIVLWLPNLPSK